MSGHIRIPKPLPFGYFSVGMNNETISTIRVSPSVNTGQDIAYLSGDNNTLNYTYCAHIDGKGNLSWSGDVGWKTRKSILVFIHDRGAGEKKPGKAYSIRCVPCRVCHRLLTDVKSIKLGAGPACLPKLQARIRNQQSKSRE